MGIGRKKSFDKKDVKYDTGIFGEVSQNSCVLLVVLCLNTLMTIMVLIAAIWSHSLAMLGDSVHMIVDNFTYAVNFWAQVQRDRKLAAAPDARKLLDEEIASGEVSVAQEGDVLDFSPASKIELLAAFVSGAALLGASVFLVVESVNRLGSTDDHEIDGKVMLIFTSIGAAFDFASMLAFTFINIPGGGHGHSHGGGGGRHSHSGATLQRCCPFNINIMSAFLHVVADFLRSISVLIAAILIQTGTTEPIATDAYTALVVAATISIGGVFIMWETGFQYFNLGSHSNGLVENDDDEHDHHHGHAHAHAHEADHDHHDHHDHHGHHEHGNAISAA